MRLKRGELVTSLKELTSGWGFSTKVVRRCLNYLEKGKRIEMKRTHSGTYIKVLNYTKYQDRKNTKVTPRSHQRANEGHAEVTPRSHEGQHIEQGNKEQLTINKGEQGSPDLKNLIWSYYSEGFEKLYGRKATIRSKAVERNLDELANHLGNRAPAIVGLFLSSTRKHYIDRTHSLDVCVSDMEKLLTAYEQRQGSLEASNVSNS